MGVYLDRVINAVAYVFCTVRDRYVVLPDNDYLDLYHRIESSFHQICIPVGCNNSQILCNICGSYKCNYQEHLYSYVDINLSLNRIRQRLKGHKKFD